MIYNYEKVCNSCTTCIVLLVIFFIIRICISSTFIHFHWYLKKSNTGVNYEPHLCNGCHDFMQKAMNFHAIAIVSVKGNNYRIHFCYMSKDDAINIRKN